MTQSPVPVRSPAPVDPAQRLIEAQLQVNSVLLGKSDAVRLALTCLLAGGHLLIEDLPGMGKTTLAHTLSITIRLKRHFSPSRTRSQS